MANAKTNTTAMMKDMMGAFPVDTKAMEDAFKNQAALNEKLTGVALSKRPRSPRKSPASGPRTPRQDEDMSKAKTEPADYAKAMTDFTSAKAESPPSTWPPSPSRQEGPDGNRRADDRRRQGHAEDAATAVKKATGRVTTATKKAAPPSKAGRHRRTRAPDFPRWDASLRGELHRLALFFCRARV